MFQLSTNFTWCHFTNVAAMNKLSRFISVLLAGSPFAVYFFTRFGSMNLEGSDELSEDIVVLTTTQSHTHKPPVMRPASDAIIMSQAADNISSMVNLFNLKTSKKISLLRQNLII